MMTDADRQFDALVEETKKMQQALREGVVLDLRQGLLLRHRLLLISDDVVNGFALYKSIERFKALDPDSFEARTAREVEGRFASMFFFLNGDRDLFLAVKDDIARMAKDADLADIQELASLTHKLASARRFYREAVETLMIRRVNLAALASGRICH